MKRTLRVGLLALLASLGALASSLSWSKDVLRVLTWEGYISQKDLSHINELLSSDGYDIEARVISPYAEGADQMYDLMRDGKVDVSFLTLFFINLQQGRIARLLQAIDVNSPRLGNYRLLNPDLTHLAMGMRDGKPLYIPFAGGSYGFYANRKKVSVAEMPKSWADLLLPRWRGKYSLNRAQVWYNVAIASMATGKAPYYLNDMIESGKRDQLLQEVRPDGRIAQTLTALYRNAGQFWDAAPTFPPELQIVSSWGVEVKQANREGGDWRLIHFKEGDLVWMDTINFVASLKGKKLEAAEIAANYLIGKEVQSRVADELSLAAVSSLAERNPILDDNPEFFSRGTFVPPYHVLADNLMSKLSDNAFKAIGAPVK